MSEQVTTQVTQDTTQRDRALWWANEVRTQRARLKRDIAAGRRLPDAHLLHPEIWSAGMQVYDLIVSIPKWGSVKTTDMLQRCHVSPHRPIGSLTKRERERIYKALGGTPIH